MTRAGVTTILRINSVSRSRPTLRQLGGTGERAPDNATLFFQSPLARLPSAARPIHIAELHLRAPPTEPPCLTGNTLPTLTLPHAAADLLLSHPTHLPLPPQFLPHLIPASPP